MKLVPYIDNPTTWVAFFNQSHKLPRNGHMSKKKIQKGAGLGNVFSALERYVVPIMTGEICRAMHKSGSPKQNDIKLFAPTEQVVAQAKAELAREQEEQKPQKAKKAIKRAAPKQSGKGIKAASKVRKSKAQSSRKNTYKKTKKTRAPKKKTTRQKRKKSIFD